MSPSASCGPGPGHIRGVMVGRRSPLSAIFGDQLVQQCAPGKMGRGRSALTKCLPCAKPLRNITLTTTPCGCFCASFQRKVNWGSERCLFTQGHETIKWPDLNSGLWPSSDQSRPQSFPSSHCLAVLPQQLPAPHAGNSPPLPTGASCPFIVKGNDFQLHLANSLSPCSALRDGEASHPSLRPACQLLRCRMGSQPRGFRSRCSQSCLLSPAAPSPQCSAALPASCADWLS